MLSLASASLSFSARGPAPKMAAAVSAKSEFAYGLPGAIGALAPSPRARARLCPSHAAR